MLIPYQECLGFLGSLKPTGVIHVGAHLGEEAGQYLAGGVRHVLWVEANEDLLDGLRWAVRGLQMESQIVHALLADRDGEEVTFNITNNSQSSSLFPLGTHAVHYPRIKVSEQRLMTTQRFDTLVSQRKIKMRPDQYQFLNMDVQGAELKILQGMGDLLKNLQAVYTEVNIEEVYKGCDLLPALEDYLQGYGFKRVSSKISESEGWGDALFVREGDKE